MNLNIKVKQTLDLQAEDIEIDENTIVIIDEADDYIIDRRLPIPEKARVLCLSATDFSRADSKEQEYIKYLRLSITDSQILNPLDSDDPPLKVDSYAEFFQKAEDFESKIIFCSRNDVDNADQAAKDAGYKDNEILLNCTDKTIIEQVGRRVLLISGSEALTRGINYRSKNGIALLTAHELMSLRGHIQYQGRVGRNGERKLRC